MALLERLAADEVVVCAEVDGEADLGLERIDLVVELVAGEDEPRLDTKGVVPAIAER